MKDLNKNIVVGILVYAVLALSLGCNYMEFESDVMGSANGNTDISGCKPPSINQINLSPEVVIPASVTDPIAVSAQVGDQITFSKIKTEVFEPNCIKCHNPGRSSGGIDLSNYKSVKANTAAINFAITRNIMPPSGPLDPVLKGLVSDWIKIGAPEFSTVIADCPPDISTPPTPVIVLPTDPVVPDVNDPNEIVINFNLIQEQIFKPRCFACHTDATGNRGRINLERYSDVVSELNDIIEEIEEGNMPPPPRPGLSVSEKDLIIKWAQIGAPI